MQSTPWARVISPWNRYAIKKFFRNIYTNHVLKSKITLFCRRPINASLNFTNRLFSCQWVAAVSVCFITTIWFAMLNIWKNVIVLTYNFDFEVNISCWILSIFCCCWRSLQWWDFFFRCEFTKVKCTNSALTIQPSSSCRQTF